MKLGLTVFLFAFGMSAAVAAAPQAKLGMKNPDAPIEVSADNLSADMNSKMAVYSGHVIIHQGEVRMRADTVRIS
ncbi:MAG: LptA/OstA family protein, partial [Rhizomicrobium sp.]